MIFRKKQPSFIQRREEAISFLRSISESDFDKVIKISLVYRRADETVREIYAESTVLGDPEYMNEDFLESQINKILNEDEADA